MKIYSEEEKNCRYAYTGNAVCWECVRNTYRKKDTRIEKSRILIENYYNPERGCCNLTTKCLCIPVFKTVLPQVKIEL